MANNAHCEQTVTPTETCNNRGMGFIVIIVLYILLAIILGPVILY